eukprot:TRINITY_DN18267_c0_g3_i1.p1 TRINITY_DN18267_c0_g3~~TRINITY_DN18267_c0_g3_i1.p1  ORF type:complete len:588 (+),score=79.50 TRINITY_DN18267_c0_g3_i1:95-1858(+)
MSSLQRSGPGALRGALQRCSPSRRISVEARAQYLPSPGPYVAPPQSVYDAIVVGGGHNGLIASCYMAKAGMRVCVLERRHVLGGAAVTEELYPGFKYSRASYVAGLLRPNIIKDLNLDKHGLTFLPRDPWSFTPSLMDGPYKGKSLMLWSDEEKSKTSIAQFSEADAEAFGEYEAFLGRVREFVDPMIDGPPIDLSGRRQELLDKAKRAAKLFTVGVRNRQTVVPFWELLTGPAMPLLDRWFESDILKTTLCTDAVIGGANPMDGGSAYVLLHHVMGESMGRKGVWSYSRGGMGAVSQAVAAEARSLGVELVTNATVDRILHKDQRACGVQLADGSVLEASTVLANCTPYHAFIELMPDRDEVLPAEFVRHISHVQYSGSPIKINMALDKLPDFTCLPNGPGDVPGPQHQGTIHFENHPEELVRAAQQAHAGIPATHPMVELTIPSAVDDSLAPPGKHVGLIYAQYAPLKLDPEHGDWADPAFKEMYVERIFDRVEKFCPGFKASVLHADVLSPLDLQQVFGLRGGNLSHGNIAIHQIAHCRPAPGYHYRSPMSGLYVCGAGAHPGGGVMGAAGKNCAGVVLSDLGR